MRFEKGDERRSTAAISALEVSYLLLTFRVGELGKGDEVASGVFDPDFL